MSSFIFHLNRTEDTYIDIYGREQKQATVTDTFAITHFTDGLYSIGHAKQNTQKEPRYDRKKGNGIALERSRNAISVNAKCIENKSKEIYATYGYDLLEVIDAGLAHAYNYTDNGPEDRTLSVTYKDSESKNKITREFRSLNEVSKEILAMYERKQARQ